MTSLSTTYDVQTRLSNLLLAMRGQGHDYQGLGHAEPYGNSEAAWDDAGELMGEAQQDHEEAEDLAAESKGVDIYAEAYANTELEGDALFKAALGREVASEAARLARVEVHKAKAAEDLKVWTAEAVKARKALVKARKALKA